MRDGCLVGRPLPMLQAATLPVASCYRAFCAAVTGPVDQDLAFHHAAADVLDTLPEGLIPGVNRFGPGECMPMTYSALNDSKAIGSYLLHDVVLSPASMAVFRPGDGLLDLTVDNLGFFGGQLSSVDSSFIDTAEGVHLVYDVGALPELDCIAVPVCGVGFPNYGHFLFDGLGAVLQHLQTIRDPRLRLVGPPLRPWQEEILDALGGLDLYVPIETPTRFRRMLLSSMLSFHTSYPTRFVRPLYDSLRFRFGGPVHSRAGLVLLSRGGDEQRRVLTNRCAVEACFAAEGFAVVRPETLSVAQQAQLMASCVVVAGETGSNLANAGFCDPGTQVLEILPDCYADGWIRALCRQMGLRWNVFLAESQDEAAARGAGCLRFSVDVEELRGAIRAVMAAI